jgi:glutamyl-tRNA synthetase
MNYTDLSNLLFPDVTQTIADLEILYPPRKNQQNTVRIAPSPTGFIHFGAIFIATVDYMFAKHNNGIFIMRIEDTDQKRQIENGVNYLVDALKKVNITMNE